MSLIVHIGSPKTATSTLQNAFFPRHQGLFFLGKEVDSRRGWKGWRTRELQDLMLGLERTHLDFRPDRVRVARLVDDIGREAGGRPVVISSEDLCLFSGIDSFAKLARVQNLFGAFGPIRVVVAVREQLSLWKSIYITEHRAEMMRMAGTSGNWHPTFDQYVDIHFRYVCGAVLESFRFAAMAERYEELFGRENVHLYAFDDFRRDQVGVLRTLCKFIGIDDADPSLQQTAVTRENAHYSARGYDFVKIRPFFGAVRRLIPSAMKNAFYRWLDRGEAFDFEPTAETAARIRDYYRIDNELLFETRGIRL